MVEVAVKIISVLVGVWAAFASYPELNEHLLALLALVGATAVGILAGALTNYVLNWMFGEVKL